MSPKAITPSEAFRHIRRGGSITSIAYELTFVKAFFIRHVNSKRNIVFLSTILMTFYG